MFSVDVSLVFHSLRLLAFLHVNGELCVTLIQLGF